MHTDQRINELAEKIRDIEKVLVAVINLREVDPNLKRKLEQDTGMRRIFIYKDRCGGK